MKKKQWLLVPMICLGACLLLSGTARAEDDSVSVPVHVERGEDYSVNVHCPAGVSTLYATYDENGRMLEVHELPLSAEPSLEVQTEDSSKAKFFALDEGKAPVIDCQEVFFDGWEERDQYGDVCIEDQNYEKAAAAFSQAIELAPEQAEPYVGRGNATILSGETEQSLDAAKSDYEKAKELDASNAGAYLGLADISVRQGDYDEAETILEEGLRVVGNDEEMAAALYDLKNGSVSDSAGKLRRALYYNTDGTLDGHNEYFYDELGRRCAWNIYEVGGTGELDEFGLPFARRCEVTYDGTSAREASRHYYDGNGKLEFYDLFVYNSEGQKTEQWRYRGQDVLDCHFAYTYDEQGRNTRIERYNKEGVLNSIEENEYDETGKLVSTTGYDPDGTVQWIKYYN